MGRGTAQPTSIQGPIAAGASEVYGETSATADTTCVQALTAALPCPV